MGGNDRKTQAFDPEQLKKLAEASLEVEELTDGPPPDPASDDDTGRRARTATLQDPLTMALLAEVARDARTQDFDPTELAADLKKTEQAADDKLPHPALKRR